MAACVLYREELAAPRTHGPKCTVYHERASALTFGAAFLESAVHSTQVSRGLKRISFVVRTQFSLFVVNQSDTPVSQTAVNGDGGGGFFICLSALLVDTQSAPSSHLVSTSSCWM